MKRFRLSTLMLFVVIAALAIALIIQHRRAAEREARLNAMIQEIRAKEVQARVTAEVQEALSRAALASAEARLARETQKRAEAEADTLRSRLGDGKPRLLEPYREFPPR